MLRPPNPPKGHPEVKPTEHPSSVFDEIKQLLNIEDLQVGAASLPSPICSAFYEILALLNAANICFPARLRYFRSEA